MKKFFVVFTLWLVPIVAVGATLQRTTMSPITEFFNVTGIVTDEVTGEPLSGVEVSLGGCPGAVGLTKRNGTFTILNVPPGTYTLRYTKEGYEILQNPATVNNDLNVTATLTPLILPPLNATVAGMVTDMNTGDLIAGAIVALDGLTYITTTNGTFSFSVEMGNYVLSLDEVGYELKTVSVAANEAKVYSVNVELVPIPPPPEGSTIINGTVTDEKTGLPIAGAKVKLNGYQATTKLNGVYSLNVSEGTYSLVVSLTGYETKKVSVNAPEKETYTVDVSLAPLSAPPTMLVHLDPYEALLYRKGLEISATTQVTAVVSRTDGTAIEGATVSFSVNSYYSWLNFDFDPLTAVTDSSGKAISTLTITTSDYQASHWINVEITASATVDDASVEYSEYLTVSLPCEECH